MIFLVRHGETAHNAAHVVQPADTPLADRGMRQALLLAQRIAALDAERVLTSNLRRARMTAEPIAAATGASLVQSELLQERNFGDIRGTPYAELGRDIFAPDYVPAGGESWSVFEARVAQAWRWVLVNAASTTGNLVVVTHGLVCRTLSLRFFGLAGLEQPNRFGNTSLTIVAPNPPHRIDLFNCVAHLDASDQGTGLAGI